MRQHRPLRFALAALAALSGAVLAGCPRQVDPLPDVVVPDITITREAPNYPSAV